MLKFLDIFFIVFHTAIIIFNLFGWVSKKTRLLNLVLLLLTGGSWFILGIFYGIGYCPFTDWHFQVLEKLGTTNLPSSYIKYIIDRITGLNTNEHNVEILTMSFYLISLTISVTLNIRDLLIKKKVKNS